MPEITDKELEEFNALKKDKADAETKRKADEEKKNQEEADRKKKEEEEKAKGGKKDEEDLGTKAAKERQAENDRKADAKKIESALKFNLGVSQFAKDHADLLPGEVESILRVADKENYDTALDKANAIRAELVKSFFSVQDNVSALTPAQKATLDDFLKLTKNGKEEKAEFIYENLFEPALQTMKRIKKAEELGKARSGFAGTDKVQDGYKARLMAASKKTHLGEKESK